MRRRLHRRDVGGEPLTLLVDDRYPGQTLEALLRAIYRAALPWWWHRRRRAQFRVERTLQAWPDIADAVGAPRAAQRPYNTP